MNKFKYYFVLLLAGIAMVSCNKSDDDEVVVTPPRDYAEQYKADNDSILKYLKTNYIKEVTSDLDITFEKIPAGGTQTSIWDQKDYELKYRDVYNRDITYRVYYLVLREGTGARPCNVDKISVAYTGTFLDNKIFDSSYGVARTFDLDVYISTIIDGWGEIMPQFRTGTSQTGNDGSITYTGFGAGVMFLPSGLGYYNRVQGDVPAYSPLTFSFKLFNLQRMDSEFTATSSGTTVVGDGIPSYLEDINGDGYLYDLRDVTRYPNPPDWMKGDDSDGDGIADFLDLDDDGDGFTTRMEITKPTDLIGWGKLNGEDFYYGISRYYPFEPVSDNPNTINVDETEPWGIPRRPTGALKDSSKPESRSNPRAFIPEDYTAAGRSRIHLDKTYPYPL
ncbi:FKBP-type peptidyl-prolyl cis-trans isomerase [Flavobacterium procerum]|uniref:peptidylprolyl isomerase n=1 Tax=Flavobacterium procerum TaxID=1455569 RepID=A0ABV6BL10_9FLAO